MHRVIYSIRSIPAAQLPTTIDTGTGEPRPMTDQELLNVGIQHIADDLYSCAEQERRDPETLEWAPQGATPPGEIITAGEVTSRHRALPAAVRAKVLRANVIRSDDTNVLELAETNLLEQQALVEEFVGDVDRDGTPAPLVDFGRATALVDEARRLADIPDNGIERATVALGDVDDAADVVEDTGLIPHSWSGERLPPGGRIA